MERSRGVLYGVGAYLIWGAFPLYWPLLEPAGAFEMLAHRLIWSLVVMAVLVVVLRRARHFVALTRNRRQLGLLTLASVTITLNWAVYIWGVTHDRVVEASLGYFINPLVTMLLGVVVLRERMRRLQWAAVAIAGVAVAVLTIDYGRVPWIAVLLASSFGTYGLAKRLAGAGAFESLALETAIMAPLALVFVLALALRGQSHFATEGTGHAALMVSAGVVTAVPLILFGAAAVRVPMVTLGLIQYLTPILQFALGVFHFHEEMSTGRWVGFAIVWLALATFTADSLRSRRSASAMARKDHLLRTDVGSRKFRDLMRCGPRRVARCCAFSGGNHAAYCRARGCCCERHLSRPRRVRGRGPGPARAYAQRLDHLRPGSGQARHHGRQGRDGAGHRHAVRAGQQALARRPPAQPERGVDAGRRR